MPEPLHHTTLAAITRLAQTHGLPIVRADTERVIVGDFVVVPVQSVWACLRDGVPLGFGITQVAALRAALREVRNGDAV